MARIVFVDYGNKSIRLSLRPHVLEYRAPANLVPLGESIADLEVVQCNKRVGVLAAAFISDTDSEDEQNNTEGKKEKMGKKSEAMRKQRARDEKITVAFIHKSSLVDRQHEQVNDLKKANMVWYAHFTLWNA